MDGMTLLQEARTAGLTVATKGDRLTIRGPRRADRLAKLLIQHKADVLPLLSADPESPTIPRPRPEETIILIPDHPLVDFEWIDKPIPAGAQHRAPDCRSSRWWEHRFGGRYCADCWPCTDPIMLATEGNECWPTQAEAEDFSTWQDVAAEVEGPVRELGPGPP